MTPPENLTVFQPARQVDLWHEHRTGSKAYMKHLVNVAIAILVPRQTPSQVLWAHTTEAT
jgi:hypothetical protein